MSDDWYTPPWLLDLLFDGKPYHDPCPLRSMTDGGLEQAWPVDRPVFVNPPYSDPSPWVKKASEHEGPVILLLPVDPSTYWWSEHAHAFRITLIGQRLRFGGSAHSARFASAIWRRP